MPTSEDWEPPNDFAVVVHDKYEFHIPKNDYFFNENDVWARLSGDRARVGISDYMQQRLTDVNYFDPPDVGARSSNSVKWAASSRSRRRSRWSLPSVAEW